MSDLNKIIESIEALSVVDALNLVKLLEEKWGVSAAAPVAVAGAAAPVEEKTEFDLLLIGAGDKKIDAMKIVRTINSALSLPDCKNLVEKASESDPQKLGTFPKEQAEKFAAEFKAIGASVKVA